MKWWERRMCALDLETTGPDPLTARVVQAALVHVGGLGSVRRHRWLVNPNVKIPPEATAIHGITDAMVEAEGSNAALAIQGIAGRLEEAWTDAEPLVVFNAPYDLTVLACELKRYGLDKLFGVNGGPVIDPLVIDKHIDRFRKGKRTLTALREHYVVRHEAAHDAYSDAIATARLAYRIGMQNEAIGSMAIDDLHDAQIGWYREQQEHLIAYGKKAGKDYGITNTDWPVMKLAGTQAQMDLKGA